MKKPLPATENYLRWGLLSLTHRAIIKARDRELMKCGISVEQSSILAITLAISATAGHKPTATELSKYLIRERHSVSETVNSMVRKRLLRRERDKKRRNLWRLSLTEKGLKTYKVTSDRRSIYSIMSALTEEEGQQLEVYLNKLLSKALKRLKISDRLPLPREILENN